MLGLRGLSRQAFDAVTVARCQRFRRDVVNAVVVEVAKLRKVREVPEIYGGRDQQDCQKQEGKRSRDWTHLLYLSTVRRVCFRLQCGNQPARFNDPNSSNSRRRRSAGCHRSSAPFAKERRLPDGI